eukprot:PITA_36179
MEKEYNSLLENQTWDLVPLPSRRKLVRCKWVYRSKSAAEGQITRWKARLVAKGFPQVHGIDYDKTFAPVAKMDSISLTLSIAAAQGGKYIRWICRMPLFTKNYLRRSTWSSHMVSFRIHLWTHDSLLILVLYVDDLLIIGSSALSIATVKRALHDRILMTDMGPLHFFLGLEISQDATGIKLSQAKYAEDLLERFRMTDCKLAPTPFLSGFHLEDGGDTPLVDSTLYRQLVGSLLYLIHSRPDLSYAVGEVSRYMEAPHELHWNAAKRIL